MKTIFLCTYNLQGHTFGEFYGTISSSYKHNIFSIWPYDKRRQLLIFTSKKILYEQHLKSSLSSLREINSIKLIYYLHFVLNIYRQFIHSFFFIILEDIFLIKTSIEISKPYRTF